PSQRESIRRMLAERSKKSLSRVIGIAAIEVLLFIISLIPPLFEKLSIETSLFSNETAVSIIGIILLVVAGGLYADKLKYGFETLFGLKPTAESAVSVACVTALIQAVYAAVTGSNAFCVAALALILVSSAADMLDNKRILDNFAVCAFKYENASFAVHTLENEAEKFEIGRGILMGNPSILYSSAVAFPEKFIEKSRENPVDPSYSSASVFAAAGLSILAAVICGFKLHSFSQAFGAFACAFCCAGGIVLKFMPSFALYNANRKLNAHGTMITSIPVADNIKQANAVAVDAENIFDLSQCTMHGMKDFKNMRIDDVLLYAAAVVIRSGGPLKESFRSVIDGQEDLLPSVKELVYEDKMGITGRIADQKVLLGNRNMLIHHNIEIPSEKYEAKYSKGGRKVIYLACNGKLCALFVVSYKADKKIGQQLKELEKNGISLLVRTNDVNITEGFIAKTFGINKSNIKVLSSVASRLYKRRKEALTEKLPAGIIHSGSAYTMLSAVTESCRLSSRSKLSFGISLALSVIGGIITAMMLTGNVGAFAGTLATIFIFASSLISSLVS
nr:hypothetical protein [Clostridiales bacterium]